MQEDNKSAIIPPGLAVGHGDCTACRTHHKQLVAVWHVEASDMLNSSGPWHLALVQVLVLLSEDFERPLHVGGFC